jgi:hypothetical protein
MVKTATTLTVHTTDTHNKQNVHTTHETMTMSGCTGCKISFSLHASLLMCAHKPQWAPHVVRATRTTLVSELSIPPDQGKNNQATKIRKPASKTAAVRVN